MISTEAEGEHVDRMAIERQLEKLEIFQCYSDSPYSSIKHSSYFFTYAELLEQYRNRSVTFVEIGILNGGSLFMWKNYFGPNARIIGVDCNPAAKRWEQQGFEIFIGDQSSSGFWRDLFEKVGEVDIVLDDGGHTNEQQIITADNCIVNIRDGGMLIVEDTHTSYFEDFGNPSRYSFVSWCKSLIDNVNSRFPSVRVSNLRYKHLVHSIGFYESIVAFKVDRKKCFQSWMTRNSGVSLDSRDFRYEADAGVRFDRWLHAKTQSLLGVSEGSLTSKAINRVFSMVSTKISWIQARVRSRRSYGYFEFRG